MKSGWDGDGGGGKDKEMDCTVTVLGDIILDSAARVRMGPTVDFFFF